MSDHVSMEPVAKTGAVSAIAGEGIRLYDGQGKTYYDLSEISTILGQKNAHFCSFPARHRA